VPNGRGRPRAKIDLVDLEKLCTLQCTQPEMAAYFEVSLATFERRAKQPKFREVMERGYLKGKISVRRKQMQLLEAGDRTMAVWLGKQLLDQRDNLDVGGNLGIAPGPINITIVYAERPRPAVLPGAPPQKLLEGGE
jgi:hypothetical protein